MDLRATAADSGLSGSVPRYAALVAWSGRAAWIGVALIGALALLLIILLPDASLPWLGWDSRTYWDAARAADPYANARVGDLGAYLYSPAFLQALRPAVFLRSEEHTSELQS